MGIFSSTKVITVDTTVLRVIEDKMLPNAIRTGGLTAIVGDLDLIPTVQEELFTSLPFKMKKYYKYARDKYAHGLPSGQFVASSTGGPEIVAILAGIHGTSPNNILVRYSHLQPANFFHFGWKQLIALYGYNPTTNELTSLSAIKGFPVYLHNMTLQIPTADPNVYSPESLMQWDKPPSSGFSPGREFTLILADRRIASQAVSVPTNTEIQFLVEYSWTSFINRSNLSNINIDLTLPHIRFETVEMPLGTINPTTALLHVKYTLGGETYYVDYDPSTKVYPSIDNMVDPPPIPSGEFFPFMYFRYDGKSMLDDKTTESYITNKKLSKILGMNYVDITTAVNEAENIEFVEQAMMFMGVLDSTTTPVERRYLFDFFNRVPEFSMLTVTDVLAARKPTFSRSLVIQDDRFKMVIEALSVNKRRVVGQIGPVDTYTLDMSTIMVDFNLATFGTQPRKVHTYRRQTFRNVYDEVSIVGLETIYRVYGSYNTTSFTDDDIRLIPIDRSITKGYTIADKEELYARSMHYIFNTKQVTKIPWWQKGPFKIIMIVGTVVLIIISLITFQFELTGAFVQALMAGATVSGAYVAAAVVALKLLAMGIVLGFAFRQLVNVIGIQGSFIAAMVLMAAQYLAPMTGASSSFRIASISSVAGAPTAISFLQLSTGLLSAIGDVLNNKLIGLQKEFGELDLLKSASEKEFERTSALLESGNNYLSPMVIFGETPDEYFNRTVHSGNIGVLSIEAVSQFVDIALLLPEYRGFTGDNV